jgi:hypothetical protein
MAEGIYGGAVSRLEGFQGSGGSSDCCVLRAELAALLDDSACASRAP